MIITKQKVIRGYQDILRAGIVDLNRTNGYFTDPHDALLTIGDTLAGRAVITHVSTTTDLPKKTIGFDWDHVGGSHGMLGKWYYEWFCFNHPRGRIQFTDEPDFYGTLSNGGMFWGDIGVVSVSTFLLSISPMSTGDMWVSVLSKKEQVLIEILTQSRTEAFELCPQENSTKPQAGSQLSLPLLGLE